MEWKKRDQQDDGSRYLSAASPKSRVPAGAIPKGVNFVLGGLAG